MTSSAATAVIDVSSRSLMPGLFDAHNHLYRNVALERHVSSSYFTSLLDSTAHRAIQGVANARVMLHAGPA